MRGVNKAIIVGNVGADPEIKVTAAGTAITNISVATSERWSDKQTGETKERTEWHRVAMFGRLAEIAGQYLRKGSQVYIEGKIQTRKWQGQDGQDRYTTEIIANEMQMLGGRQGGQGDQSGHNGPEARPSYPSSYPQPQTPAQGGGAGFDDRIPF